MSDEYDLSEEGEPFRTCDIDGYCPHCNMPISYKNPREDNGCRACRQLREKEEEADERDGFARFILFDIFFGGH
jgi:hypothetical protein